MDDLGSDPRSDIGPILDYLKDTTKLPPELVRPEQFRFEHHQVNQALQSQTISNRVDPNYIYVLRRIKGYVSRSAVNGEYVHLYSFNVADQGRARGGIFDDTISMAALAGESGPAHDMLWDGFYAFIPGSDIAVDWTVTLTDLPRHSDILVGVSLTGDLVRVRRLPGSGALAIPGVTDR